MQEAGKTSLVLENRESMHITGVQSIEVFEEDKIALRTELGALEIQGMQLNITQLDLNLGTVQITGNIDGVLYPQEKWKRKNTNRQKQSFFNRMLS